MAGSAWLYLESPATRAPEVPAPWLLHRELRTRFLGFRFGWLWSLINPLMILATYSVVFGIVMGGDRGLAPSANGVRIFAVYLFTTIVP